MKYLIGLDNGGTVTKAIVINTDGKLLAKASRKIKTISERPLFVERDMEEVWQKNCQVIKEAIEKANINRDDIIAISISGHGKGLYPMGYDGKIVMNSILSTDNRAYEYTEKWKNDGTNEYLRKFNYQDLIPVQVPALVRWIMDNKKDLLDQIEWFFGIKDFLSYKLTGEARAEITDFSGSGILDLNTRSYSDEIFEKLGLGEVKDKFPTLIKSTEIAGKITKEASQLTGLPEGCVLAAGAFDIDACAIAMDIRNEDYLAIIGGTWSINEFIAKDFKVKNRTTKNSLYCIDDYVLIEESSPTSASNFEWFLNTLAENKDENKYDIINEKVRNCQIDVKGPLFFPYIYGSNYSEKAKATIIGMDSSTKNEEIYRAIYEGVAFSHKVHIDKLLEVKDDFKAFRLTGGISNSPIWIQIFADILDKPIEVIDQEELGAYGACILASVGVGVFDTIEEASKKLVKVKETYYPNKENVEKYKEKFKKYKAISESLDLVWDNFN